jgi:predicted nucleic acid-binding protein
VDAVIDASVLVTALGDPTGGQDHREQLEQLVGSDYSYILPHTKLEVLSGLRGACQRGELSNSHCELVAKGMSGWPFRLLVLTQPIINRVWEHRHNMSTYDAAYAAATELLQSEIKRPVTLATADGKLATAAQTAGVHVTVFAL